MKTRLSLRKTAYPTKAELQPFINGHNKISSGHTDDHSEVAMDPLSSRVPFNSETIRLGLEYREAFPTLLQARMADARDFFLQEITPFMLACSNGLQDAQDIMESAFNEKADVANVFGKIEDAVHLALNIKILNFAKNFAGLDAVASRQFLTLAFAHELKTNEDVTAKLLSMLKLTETAVKRATVKKPEPVETPTKPVRKTKKGA